MFITNKYLLFLAEKDQTDAPEPEPKKERRKSVGRPATRTTNGRSKTTPARSSTKNKKLAVFSSDEEVAEDEATVKSVNTSPIGFPSPEVSIRDVSTFPIDSTTKKYTAASSTRRLSSKVDAISRKSTTTYKTKKAPDLMTQAYQPSRKVSEFSDDDLGEPYKSKYTSSYTSSAYSSGYSTSNGLHHRPVVQTRKDADDFIFKKPSAVPSSTTPTTHHFSSSPSPSRILSPAVRKNSPLLNKTPFDEEKIRSKVDEGLHQLRKSFSSKKPSPLTNTRTVSNTKYNDTEEESETDEELEDEEIDVEYGSRGDLWQMFVKNKTKLFIFFFALLFATAAIWAFLYNSDEMDRHLGIGQSNG